MIKIANSFAQTFYRLSYSPKSFDFPRIGRLSQNFRHWLFEHLSWYDFFICLLQFFQGGLSFFSFKFSIFFFSPILLSFLKTHSQSNPNLSPLFSLFDRKMRWRTNIFLLLQLTLTVFLVPLALPIKFFQWHDCNRIFHGRRNLSSQKPAVFSLWWLLSPFRRNVLQATFKESSEKHCANVPEMFTFSTDWKKNAASGGL